MKLENLRRSRQKARIDDSSTRDALYSHYHLLSRELDLNENERSGRFGTDTDELWALRDRVVCRLAIWEVYGTAMQEAKAADVDV